MHLVEELAPRVWIKARQRQSPDADAIGLDFVLASEVDLSLGRGRLTTDQCALDGFTAG